MITSFVSPKASVIVHNLNIPRIVIGPPEADAPLVINPDTHLPDALPLKGLQSIFRWITQILQRCRNIQLAQLAQGSFVNIARKLPARLALPNALGIPALE
jgi:hypothetical protein